MKIFFIYNATSRYGDAAADSLKKLVGNPVCSLCDITHGLVFERRKWKNAAAKVPHEIVYLHKDDQPEHVATFLKKENIVLPVILREDDKKSLSVLLPDLEITACHRDETCLLQKIQVSLTTKNESGKSTKR